MLHLARMCGAGLLVVLLSCCSVTGTPRLPAKNTGHSVLVENYRMDVGDQVILSDMSRWDTFDRIRLR